MSKPSLDYIGGLFDCIGRVYWVSRRPTKTTAWAYVELSVRLTHADKGVMLAVRNALAGDGTATGSVTLFAGPHTGREERWRLNWAGKHGIAVLTRLRPHLRAQRQLVDDTLDRWATVQKDQDATPSGRLRVKI